MPKKRTTRIYWKGGRAYGDFRDMGGGQEALVPPEERLPGKRGKATDDADVAAKLCADRVTELTEKRRNRGLGIVEKEPAPGLKAYAAYHLIQKKRDGECTDTWIASSQHHIARACAFFGDDRPLDSIQPEHLTAWVNELRKLPGRKGRRLSETTARKGLNTLSNMFARAVSEDAVSANPVAQMYSKPTEPKHEADYLPPEEIALLLESARTYKPAVAIPQEHGGEVNPKGNPHVYPFLATLALTGCRFSEVAGLLVDDVSLNLGKVYIRPNELRRLKTRGSKRAVPLWPQLREILEAYFAEREKSGGLGTLLFPGRGSDADGKERLVTDIRKALGAIAKRAGFPDGSVRPHMLRHSYCAARIQTSDRGRPIAMYTVARELGHSSTSMIEDVYGHLHDRAHDGGTEVVEFRTEHYAAELEEALARLRAG